MVEKVKEKTLQFTLRQHRQTERKKQIEFVIRIKPTFPA